ncbi:MAG TPA: glycosyltransferase [Hyphomonadaceae bacterium]|jgi:glycosyltransferase involved in cell wall biosynthesis
MNNLRLEREPAHAGQSAAAVRPLRPSPVIAVLLPCYNEALTIAKVVTDFRTVLPAAQVYVYDNNSTDGTADVAGKAGAIVYSETWQGKGSVVRRMFADVDADIYVMVDGDDTYDVKSAPRLIAELTNRNLDMVNGARETRLEKAYRPGHRFGNWFLTGAVRWSFGDKFKDMLSGYRVMSRRFVKSFPALSDGFEIETELTVHALRLRMPTAEIGTPYFERPPGSVSKLNTFRDGFRIMRVITRMVRDEKPMEFFGGVAAVLMIIAIALTIPVLMTFAQTGLVPRFPTLILAVGLAVVSVISFAIGLILDTLSRVRNEQRRLAYLSCRDRATPPEQQ